MGEERSIETRERPKKKKGKSYSVKGEATPPIRRGSISTSAGGIWNGKRGERGSLKNHSYARA